MPRPNHLLLSPRQFGLATDLYELTMAAGYRENGINGRAVFELFIRDLPADRGYLIAAGLEQAVAYLRDLQFTDDDAAFLRDHPSFRHVSDGFFDDLKRLRFTGDVWAVPEGTVVFAGEPLLRVEAPIIEAQIVETYLLTTLTYQTLVATKASRIVGAAVGRGVVDFGSRRAHGPGAGLLAARAAFIGGCQGTSNVLAARLLGIPAVGTAAHAWTMAFDDETAAFEAYVRVFPDGAILLVDTYDTLEGTRRAVAVARERLKAVRLDSGDLASLSTAVLCILDEAGLAGTKIVASGDLNEYRIADLLSAGAPIDLFGVGTDLVTGRDAPALGGVYKLVAVERDGAWRPCLKRSPGKATYPWPKQVYRRTDDAGRYVSDTIARADEDQPGTPLLLPVVRGGTPEDEWPDTAAIQARATAEVQRLDSGCRRLQGPAPYDVRVSDALIRAAEEVGTPWATHR